jgi:hypothetical protein
MSHPTTNAGPFARARGVTNIRIDQDGAWRNAEASDRVCPIALPIYSSVAGVSFSAPPVV